MREIKFRCWYDKRMHKVVDIDFSYKRINLLGADIISFEQGILMQYTGLKDKNGKEIYEGDIVKYRWDCNYSYFIIKYDIEHCGFLQEPICKNKNMWEIVVNDGKSTNGKAMGLEVIGNIHDNPELLKEVSK